MVEFEEHRLDSGLRVVAERDGRAYSTAIGVFVSAGSRFENDAQSGLSHFLEHMMFKGTARMTAAEVNRELDNLGGNANAYTSEEQTVYYATVLPKFQHRLVGLLADMMMPTLAEPDFETERQVILEEIAKYDDQPPFGAFERSMERRYGPRGLGRRILGTKESIAAMSAEQLRRYFDWRYRPERMVVAATGNVDFDALVRQLETAEFNTRSPGAIADEVTAADDPSIDPPGIDRGDEITIPGLHQNYVVGIGDSIGSGDPDRFAVRTMASILGDEGGSRLFWELIDTGRAEVATVWPQEFSDGGAFFRYLVCEPDDVEMNSKLINDVIERMVADGVTADELEQTVAKGVAGVIMSSERPSNRLFGLGSRYLDHGQYISIDDAIERIRELRVEDIDRAAAKILNRSTETIRVIADLAPV